jgi:hypothetical protein
MNTQLRQPADSNPTFDQEFDTDFSELVRNFETEIDIDFDAVSFKKDFDRVFGTQGWKLHTVKPAEGGHVVAYINVGIERAAVSVIRNCYEIVLAGDESFKFFGDPDELADYLTV